MRNVNNSPFLDSSTTNYTNGSHASSTHGQINPRSHNSSTSTDPPNNNTQWGNVSHSVPACQYCGRCDHTAKTCYKLHGIGTPLIIISTKQICHNMITVLIPIGCLICDLGNLSVSFFNTLAPPLYFGMVYFW